MAETDPRAAQARAILQREGIDVNDAVNGVYLPKNRFVPNLTGAAVHSTLHTNIYHNTVLSELQNAEPGTVGDVLRDIGQRLQNDSFSR